MLNQDSALANRNLASPVVSPFTATHDDANSPALAFPVTTPVLAPPHQGGSTLVSTSALPLTGPNAASPTDDKSLILRFKSLPPITAAPASNGPLAPLYPVSSTSGGHQHHPNGVVLPSLQIPQQPQQIPPQQQMPISHHQIPQAQQPPIAYVNPHKPQESPLVYLAVPENYRYVAYNTTPLQRQSCPPNVPASLSQSSPPAQPWVAVPVTTYGTQYIEPQYYHLGSTPSYVYHTAQYIYNQQSAIGQPRKQTKQTTWTPEEDKLLRQLKGVQKLGWREISAFFYDRTPNACQFRWRRIISGIASTKSHGPKSIATRSLGQISKKSHHSINFLLN